MDFGEDYVSDSIVKNVFARFRAGNFCLEDDSRHNEIKKFEDEELHVILDESISNSKRG